MAEKHPPAARSALITGASRGIGRELALGLARAGLDVGLLARDAVRLEEVAGEIRALGRTAVAAPADVTDASALSVAVATIEAGIGPVDLLVNNAGRFDAEVPPWEADPQEWWAIMETNVLGPFLLDRAIIPGMLARGGGRIIDLSSGAAVRDTAASSAYYTSKTALFRLGGSIHEAGYPRGLRIFELAPGVVRTDMTSGTAMHADRTEWNDVAEVVELAVMIARGGIDELSGRYVRAGTDTPASLRFQLGRGAEVLQDHVRRLRAADWPEK